MNRHLNKIYRIGDASITKITDHWLEVAPPSFMFPQWEQEELARNLTWLVPGNMTSSKEFLIQSIHSWLVRTKDHTILIDTGAGNDKERPKNPLFHHLNHPYLERLAAAGVRPEEVDYVLLTHVHVDHVGWNTRLIDGRWVPTFPNARYVMPKVDVDYYGSPASHIEAQAHSLGIYEDSVAPLIEAGLVDDIGPEGGEVLGLFRYHPTPGHSLGHMSISMRTQGEEALFSGDLFHHPLQVYRPDWNSVFCDLQDEARASRLWGLTYAAQKKIPLFSTHFAETSAGYVTRESDGFSWRYE